MTRVRGIALKSTEITVYYRTFSREAWSGQGRVGCKSRIICQNVVSFLVDDRGSRSWLATLKVVAQVRGSTKIEGKGDRVYLDGYRSRSGLSNKFPYPLHVAKTKLQ